MLSAFHQMIRDVYRATARHCGPGAASLGRVVFAHIRMRSTMCAPRVGCGDIQDDRCEMRFRVRCFDSKQGFRSTRPRTLHSCFTGLIFEAMRCGRRDGAHEDPTGARVALLGGSELRRCVSMEHSARIRNSCSRSSRDFCLRRLCTIWLGPLSPGLA